MTSRRGDITVRRIRRLVVLGKVVELWWLNDDGDGNGDFDDEEGGKDGVERCVCSDWVGGAAISIREDVKSAVSST